MIAFTIIILAIALAILIITILSILKYYEKSKEENITLAIASVLILCTILAIIFQVIIYIQINLVL